MAIVTVDIDLAKNVFAVHSVDEAGKPRLVRPEVARAKLIEIIAQLPRLRHCPAHAARANAGLGGDVAA